ncbi:hypothetical protein FACS1894152_7340 [Bacilli bacterium]|nr:hypothetical protein FACS1894152_7340 [Bacilli bacterium]
MTETRERKIKYFLDKRRGVYPYLEWVVDLEPVERNIVDRQLGRVMMGNYGSHRSLGGGVFELKFHNGLRIYFAEVDKTIVLLFSGGDKSSQTKDIKKAKEYKETLDKEGLEHCVK